MVTHLYKNFLTDEKVYLQTIEFWKSMIYTLLSAEKITFQDYLTTIKSDGSTYKDGNPIYHFKIDNSNRAVRIVQEEPECNCIEFSAWLNTLEVADGSKIEELVICLELSQETALMTVELINAWILNKFSKPKMQKMIDKLFAINETIFKEDLICA